MGRLYKALGLRVGVIVHDLDDQERQANYNADITYGTNNLRDNMKFRLEDCVQRGHYFAIVDEVDSILIDEARTPLIISGPSEDSTVTHEVLNARSLCEPKQPERQCPASSRCAGKHIRKVPVDFD